MWKCNTFIVGEEYKIAYKDNDDNLTFEELERYMKKVNYGSKYDQTKIRELHEELDCSNNGKVTLEEFCKAYSYKIENYEVQILECKRRSTEIRHEIMDINTQKQDIARAENMNQFGIMEGSVLIVTV